MEDHEIVMHQINIRNKVQPIGDRCGIDGHL